MAKKSVGKKTPVKEPAIATAKGASSAKKPSAAKSNAAKIGGTASPGNGSAGAAGREWSGAEVGHAAGRVWQQLAEQGPQTIAALKKGVGGSPDMVMAAVGWLAREGKLAFRPNGRAVQVALVEEPPA